MKKLIFVMLIGGVIVSCNNSSTTTEDANATVAETAKSEENSAFASFGSKISPENSIPVGDFMSSFNTDSAFVKLTGKVDAVCQKKGCWMNINLENGETMKVTFKDYGFFVPKDITGKKVVIEGKALKQITSVDVLKHYAEDAGKSAEEIEAITEDKQEVVFEAEGVLVSTI